MEFLLEFFLEVIVEFLLYFSTDKKVSKSLRIFSIVIISSIFIAITSILLTLTIKLYDDTNILLTITMFILSLLSGTGFIQYIRQVIKNYKKDQ